MKNSYKLFSVISAICLLSGSLIAQPFRVGTIPAPLTSPGGYGNFVAGVDLDKDGLQEIYVVNNNVNDSAEEMIPAIYKYEFTGTGWALVWTAKLDVPRQNTWPCLAVGDLDKDGKKEIVWGPVNNFDKTAQVNPNPARIAVFEVKGDGSDILGVSDGFDGYKPNAKWTICTEDYLECRPFRWEISDIDNDSKDEIIFGDRQVNYHFGVISVTDIPDNGDGSEAWTLEYSGKGLTGVSTGLAYDVAVIGSRAYFPLTTGEIAQVTYSNSAYSYKKYAKTIFPGGSWKSACVADIDGNGTKEIVMAGFTTTNQKVYVIQEEADTIKSVTMIANLASKLGSASARIYGGAVGDIDGNGKIDFVFGTRDAVPNAMIIRLEYLGGSITDTNSYSAKIFDSGIMSKGGRWDELAIANIDGDPDNEVLYSSGYSTDDLANITILDMTGTLPVELKSFNASVKAGAVELNWATATETNNSGFEIQRKSGNDFMRVGFVQGKGTTSESQSYSFQDNNAAAGKNVYRLKQVNMDGSFEYSSEVEVNFAVPSSFSLEQNFPNPFNPSTTITYSIPAASRVTLNVYNMLGEEVASLVRGAQMDQGTHSVSFNASNLPSGAYVYRLQAGSMIISKKMTLTK